MTDHNGSGAQHDGSRALAGGARPAYRDANVLVWLAAYTASILGDSVYFLALGWTAALVAGPSEVGFVLAVGALPRAVLMLVGGVVADLVGPRRVLIISDLARFAAISGLALVFLATVPDLWILIAVALFFGVVDALFMPAIGALPPYISTEDQLARVQGMRAMALRLGHIVGPPAAGAAVAQAGPGLAFGVAGLAFGVALVLLLILRIDTGQALAARRGAGGSSPASDAENNRGSASPVLADREAADTSGGTDEHPSRGNTVGHPRTGAALLRRELVDGLRYIWSVPLLRVLVIVAGVSELAFLGPLNVGIVLLTDARGWGAGSLGVIVGAFGVGTGASALLLAVVGRVRRAGLVSCFCLLIAGVMVPAVGTAPTPVAAAAFGGLLGASVGFVSVAVFALIQTSTDRVYLSRVTSVLTLATLGIAPLSYPVMGALVGAFGPGVAFACFGALAGAAALLALSLPTFRAAELPVRVDEN